MELQVRVPRTSMLPVAHCLCSPPLLCAEGEAIYKGKVTVGKFVETNVFLQPIMDNNGKMICLVGYQVNGWSP